MRPSYLLFPTRTPGFTPANGVTNPTGTVYSEKTFVGDDNHISLVVRTTGTLTGTLSLWYSNKMEPDVSSDTDWDQDTAIVLTQPAGSATVQRLEVGNLGARFARVKYVHTSGTGVLSGEAS
jgi:hypothetical protein